jgi:hypothetical protein
LLAASTIRVLWTLSDDDTNQWNARLRGDLTFTAVVLGTPPTSRVTRLKMAVRAGVPVILWDRREQRPADFEEVVAVIVSGWPMALDVRVRELRSKAAEVNAAADASHPGRHLAVLWDDPGRLVDVPPFGPFGADGQAREHFDSE